MDLQQYRQRKAEQQKNLKNLRQICSRCWQPDFSCFCHKIEKFNPQIEFVVLIHPIESRRRIATGRMTYLTLEHAHIIRGAEFSKCPQVARLLSDSNYNNVMLSPGPGSIDVTNMPEETKREHFATDKKLRIFLIDGTWSTARKMVNQSPGLLKIPRFCFTPDKPSNIRVRKQPNPQCYCTLEATHHIIELLGSSQGLDTNQRLHDRLLIPFDWMVDQQVELLKHQRKWRTSSSGK